jgi:SAM-dependent methyltransferase
MLTAVTGLSGLVDFAHGDALAMPFPTGVFDLVWTQHSSMNIDDKERLYAEIHRVLRPGGRLALHEVMAGRAQPVRFPVPWARDPAISFLRSPEEICALIRAAGFAEIAWVDVTASATDWYRRWTMRPAPDEPGPLGLHLLLGPEILEMGRNVLRNLEEGRIAVIQGVFDRAVR